MNALRLGRTACVAGLVYFGTSPLLAQDSPNPPPSVLSEVLACQNETDPLVRLACYDDTVSKLEQARVSNQVVVADREQIDEAKRGLFGFNLPNLKLFSRAEGDEVNEIQSTIARLSRDSRGKWLFVLEDGARWAQTDTKYVRPEVGDKIRIRRAAMGSYLANVNDATAIRVKRSD